MDDHQYKDKSQYRQRHLSKTSYATTSNNSSENHCTFCGAVIDDDEAFCSECGNPRAGIVCPNCHTLCFRSFCSRCNTPLNELAQNAVAAAKRDPHFQRAQQLTIELEELEKRVKELQCQVDAAPAKTLDTSANLSADVKAMISSYDDLFANIDLKIPDKPIQKPAHQPQNVVKVADLLKSALADFEAKKNELQAELNAMLPEPNSTPEEQRNFFCARKVQVKTLTICYQAWVCNFCGCHHNAPSECVREELGGTWIMETQESITTSTIY